MKIHRFEDVIARQRAQDFAVHIYIPILKIIKIGISKTKYAGHLYLFLIISPKDLIEALMQSLEDFYTFLWLRAVKQNQCCI